MSLNATPPLVALWREAAQRFGTRPALLGGQGWQASYADVTATAAAVEAALQKAALPPGAAVLISLSRGPLWLPGLLGIWRAGGVAVPTTTDPNVAAAVAQSTAAAAHLHDGATASGGWPGGFTVDAITAPPSSTSITADHAYAMPTSGTTGTPKYALVTHATSAAVLTGLRNTVRIEDGERSLHTAAFTFSSSIRQLLLPVLAGAAVIVFDRNSRFDPAQLLRSVAEHDITSLDLTPSQLTAVTRWLELEPDAAPPRQLRRLLVASEAFPPALLARWRRVAPAPHTVYHMYGQTELGGAISALPLPDTAAAGGMDRLPLARPFAPFTATLDKRPDGLGELVVAGLDRNDGYLNADGLDRSQFSDPANACSGGYRTGDLFAERSDGALEFQGRSDAQIKILGVRVDVLRLEQALSAIPGVEHAVVFAEPGPAASTLRIAYTTERDAPLALAEAAQQLVAGLPAPELVRLPEMPLTVSGKIDRPAVERLLAAPPPDGGNDNDGAEDVVVDIWRRFTHAEAGATPDDQQDFFTSGGHSLSMLELLAEVRRHLGVRLLPEQFHRASNLAGLRELVRQAVPDLSTVTAPPSVPAPTSPDAPVAAAREAAASAVQQQIWLAEQLAGQPISPFWLPIDIDVPGPVDPDRLEYALRLLTARFDVLRVGFARHGSQLTILPDAFGAGTVRLHTGGTADTVIADDLLTAMTDGPLLHAGIAQRDAGATIGVRLHHAVADRSSITQFLQHLARAYAGPDTYVTAPSAPSYLTWLQVQAQAAAAGRDAAATYWASILPPPAANPGRPGPPQIERTTINVTGGVSPEPGTTVHAMWLGAYRMALTGRVSQPELIGVDIDLRASHERSLAGPCVTTLPVVLPDHIVANGSARAAMAAVTRTLPHRSVPIGDVVPADRRPTGDPRHPFYRNSFVYQPDPYPQLRLADQPATYRRTPTGVATSAVNLFVRNTGTGATVELAWDRRVLDSGAARDIITATADALGLLERAQP